MPGRLPGSHSRWDGSAATSATTADFFVQWLRSVEYKPSGNGSVRHGEDAMRLLSRLTGTGGSRKRETSFCHGLQMEEA